MVFNATIEQDIFKEMRRVWNNEWLWSVLFKRLRKPNGNQDWTIERHLQLWAQIQNEEKRTQNKIDEQHGPIKKRERTQKLAKCTCNTK